MIKKPFLLSPLFFVFLNLFSVITQQEIESVFEYSSNIKQSLMQTELSNIEAFLKSPTTAPLLFARPKLNKLHEDTWSPEDIQNNATWHTQVFDLFRSHHITNYNGTSIRGRNFVLTSQKLFPSYLIKIPRHLLSQKDKEPFLYQNISRILYNKLIYEHINAKNLKHIYPVKKCLMHVPGQPTELSDQNYALVVEKITSMHASSIYTAREDANIFKNVFEQALHGNHEALELVAEILYLIKKVGLWDISHCNIFFIENYKIAFIDTEKDWDKESDQNFFHRDAEEFEKLCRHGIALLSRLLCDDPSKAASLEEKFMLFQGDGNLVEEMQNLLRKD
jgi:hypothetical protein